MLVGSIYVESKASQQSEECLQNGMRLRICLIIQDCLSPAWCICIPMSVWLQAY